MKTPAFLMCLAALVLAAMPVRQAKADDVSFDVFYNNLADDGDWYNTPDYGYVWHPAAADKSEKWRPYTDGYWAQTDDGWTWVSYENFGWATYHYGRWTRLKDTGWVWVPGYDWGPGWVSWRTSDDNIGWAPLPPKPPHPAEDDQPSAPAPSHRANVEVDYNTIEPADYGPDVDVQYDIGPENYCFVETRHFGAPVLAEVILPPERNITVIERTVNVTNIYRPPGGPGAFVVYNRGPDYNFINAHCERPIQVLRIERHDDVAFLNNGVRGGANINAVRGGVFTVAAPPIRRGPVNFAQVKPVRVKQTIERTEVVHGWNNSGADQATVQRLRAQFKEQAQKATPPPRDSNPPRPAQLAHDQQQRSEGNQPPRPANNPQAEANQPPNPAGQPPPPGKRGPNNRPNNGQPAATPAPNAPGANGGQQGLTPEEKQARRQQRQQGQNPAVNENPAAANPNTSQGLTPEEKQARRQQHQQGKGQPAPATGQNPSDDNKPAAANPNSNQGLTPEEKQARRQQRQQDKAQPQPKAQQPEQGRPSAAPSQDNPDRDARRQQRQQEKAQQQGKAPQGQQPPDAAPQSPQGNPDRDARRAQHQQDKAQQDEQGSKPPAKADAPNSDREANRPPHQQDKAAQGGGPSAQGGQPKQPAQNPDRDEHRAQHQQTQPTPQPHNAQSGTQQGNGQQGKGGDKSDSDKKKKGQPDQ